MTLPNMPVMTNFISDNFESQLHSLFDEQLITNTGNIIIPSTAGMFYADSMASLFVKSNNTGFYKRKMAKESVSNMAGHM